MAFSKKMKSIDSKINQNKAQYNSNRQAANTSALSSGNFFKYEFLTGEDVLPAKGLFGKTATIKILKYLSLARKLKKKTDIAKNNIRKVHGFNKKVMKKERDNSEMVYNNFNFSKFNITDKEFDELSADTKYIFFQQNK